MSLRSLNRAPSFAFFLLSAAIVLVSVGTASAEFRGVGPRFGVGSDPDQFLMGLHFDAGRFAPNVRFQPDVEIGVGDDLTVVSFTIPAHYLFPVSGDVRPFMGGGLGIGVQDRDYRGDGDDTDVEMGLVIAGGAQWQMSGNDLFFLELDLIAGDLHDFEFVAGFTFR
ncbi:MAG: hypothetical protein ACT4PE_08140 [Candidatus Eiseniibacteriota bacterium]